MKIKRVLLLHKISPYQYLLQRPALLAYCPAHSRILARFKKTHSAHYQTLRHVEKVLRARGIPYVKKRRGQTVDYRQHDLVISVGGDGTFLEAARHLQGQYILGVNSDPVWSVGRLCTTCPATIEKALERILSGKFRVRPLHRLQLTIAREARSYQILNDVLVCHRNPAAMSHYVLRIGKRCEEQRSSGVWISTAAGSTGAIHSAGGQTMALTSKNFQYRVREIYENKKHPYHLTSGSLRCTQRIHLTSFMTDGVLFVDGAHLKIPFPYGRQAVLRVSPHPLQVLAV